VTDRGRSNRWVVERERGRASDLLGVSADRVGRGAPLVPTARVLEVTAPALVLGSGQPDGDVDRTAAELGGVDVTRRRSGGGAVLLSADVLWVDLILPVGDPRWDADVGRAAWWVGEAWVGAIDAVGGGEATVWRGRLRRSEWSDRVCFAGMGPGEVALGGRKVVGVAQRRTRAGALFQTAVLLRWDPDPILALMDLPATEKARAAAAIGPAATGIGVARRDALITAFLGTLMP
jgi:lipoate---protein ligase